ncbi:acyl carrier protein [Serratia phage phiMAM1]|uniref:Acyl carrier protein n=1 Tax=Serratia phage phiMAM1 TaxID=1262513 RepID=K7YXY3_9CAUD|nr:acyl carrier protein [Serratia phage phiMAM1]AFX93560.1 acyl carrier protein [Serratia phage phiMAM1]
MAVNKEDVLAQVIRSIKELSYHHIGDKLNVEDPSKLTINDDLWFDELDRIELIMELEEHYEIEIDDEKVEAAVTVGDVVNLVEKLVNELG